MASLKECASIISTATRLEQEHDKESLCHTLSVMSFFLMANDLEAEFEEFMNDVIVALDTEQYDSKDPQYIIDAEKEEFNYDNQ